MNAGLVYIGEPDQDPETYPLTVYWDAEGTDPVSQPVTTIGGYLTRAGSPAEVFGPTAYSIRVRDKFGVQVFYSPYARGLVAGRGEDILDDGLWNPAAPLIDDGAWG